jgi:Sec-independent protein translocase protein TatA
VFLSLLDDLGFYELLLIGVVALLVWGKRLPEVAAQAGAQVAKLRRALQDVKSEVRVDTDLRKFQRAIEDAVPRDLSLGDVARKATSEVERRLRETRAEIEEGLGRPAPGASAPPNGSPTPEAPAPRESEAPPAAPDAAKEPPRG